MKQEWGREGYAGDWPSDRRVWTIAAFFVALASVAAIYVYRYERVWTPLERFYLAQYLNSGTNLRKNTGHYLLLNVVDKKGSRLALDEEVTETGESAYALTDEAVKAGDLRLEWQRGQFDNAKMRAYLGHWIYRDQTFLDLTKPPRLRDSHFPMHIESQFPEGTSVPFCVPVTYSPFSIHDELSV